MKKIYFALPFLFALVFLGTQKGDLLFQNKQSAAIFEARVASGITASSSSSLLLITDKFGSTSLQAKIPIQITATPGVSLFSQNIRFSVYRNGVKYTDFIKSPTIVFSNGTSVWNSSSTTKSHTITPVFTISALTKKGIPLPFGDYYVVIDSVTWVSRKVPHTFQTYGTEDWRTPVVYIGPKISARFVSEEARNAGDTPLADDDRGRYSFVYKLKATGGDVYLPDRADQYLIRVEKDGVPISVSSANVTPGFAGESGLLPYGSNVMILKNGTEANIQFVVNLQLGNALTRGNYRVLLTGVKWGPSPTTVVSDLSIPGFPFGSLSLYLN